MKLKLRYIFGTLVITGSLMFPAVVLAEQNSTSSNSGSDSSETSDTTTTSSDDTTTTETETEFHNRLELLKTKFKVKLGAAEALHLKAKCKPAQSVVGKLHTKFGNSITVRTQAYTELQKNLDKLVTKLKAKNVDTATLETQITQLKTLIATYQTDLTAYKQALTDLKAVDCVTSPDEFQAALDSARAAHDKLVTDVVAIRTYLKDTIKPTLQAIKKQLEGQDSSTNDNKESN